MIRDWYKECMILIFTWDWVLLHLFLFIFWSRCSTFTTRPFCFLSCIMLTGQDSRPIHVSHLICSKLILVSKVKQNSSRFSFAALAHQALIMRVQLVSSANQWLVQVAFCWTMFCLRTCSCQQLPYAKTGIGGRLMWCEKQ
jgi:hypothetical protein